MTWLLTLIATIGLALNIYKKRLCFVVWAISNSALLVLSIMAGTWGIGTLFAVQLAGSVYGWFAWKPERKLTAGDVEAIITRHLHYRLQPVDMPMVWEAAREIVQGEMK